MNTLTATGFSAITTAAICGISPSPSNYSVVNVSNNGLASSSSISLDLGTNPTIKSLLDSISRIESRLLILKPDPEKIKKYEALQKAYNHYCMLEALLQDEQQYEK